MKIKFSNSFEAPVDLILWNKSLIFCISWRIPECLPRKILPRTDDGIWLSELF